MRSELLDIRRIVCVFVWYAFPLSLSTHQFKTNAFRSQFTIKCVRMRTIYVETTNIPSEIVNAVSSRLYCTFKTCKETLARTHMPNRHMYERTYTNVCVCVLLVLSFAVYSPHHITAICHIDTQL